jgi:uncharacterized membrane protein
MNVKTDKQHIICAALGFLGAAVSLVIGLYLLSTMANLSSIQDETSQIWTASLATAIVVITTAYGSYTILKGNSQKGGTINVAGGIILVIMYSYFSEFSQPKFLEWLNPFGIALVIPPILSGVIDLIGGSKSWSTIDNKRSTGDA